MHPTATTEEDPITITDQELTHKSTEKGETHMQLDTEGGSQNSIVLSQEEASETTQINTSSKTPAISIPPGMIMVQGPEGEYLMDANKWPNLEVRPGGSSSEAGKDIKGDAPDRDMHDLSVEGRDQGWTLSGPKRKDRKPKQPAVATRTSSRIPKSGGPILEKATRRMQERDELLGGNKPQNPFTVFDNVPRAHISTVIKDLGIEVEDIDTQIDVFRAEEKVRVALAEANYKAYLERLKAKSAPQEGDLADFAMEIIDNTCRGAEGQARQEAAILEGEGRAELRSKSKYTKKKK